MKRMVLVVLIVLALSAAAFAQSQAEIDKEIKKIEVGSVTGDYIELVGPKDAQPRQALLGVMAVGGETAWFIKMKGDAALVAKEKPAFEAFVNSIRFKK